MTAPSHRARNPAVLHPGFIDAPRVPAPGGGSATAGPDLSEGPPRGRTRGEALRFSLADRRVEDLLGILAEARTQGISDDELDQALKVLDHEELTVSASRQAVFRVHDRLQDELKRRFRKEPSSVQPH